MDLQYFVDVNSEIHNASKNCPDAFSLAAGAPHPDTIPIAKSTIHCKDGTTVEINEVEMREGMTYQAATG